MNRHLPLSTLEKTVYSLARVGFSAEIYGELGEGWLRDIPQLALSSSAGELQAQGNDCVSKMLHEQGLHYFLASYVREPCQATALRIANAHFDLAMQHFQVWMAEQGSKRTFEEDVTSKHCGYANHWLRELRYTYSFKHSLLDWMQGAISFLDFQILLSRDPLSRPHGANCLSRVADYAIDAYDYLTAAVRGNPPNGNEDVRNFWSSVRDNFLKEARLLHKRAKVSSGNHFEIKRLCERLEKDILSREDKGSGTTPHEPSPPIERKNQDDAAWWQFWKSRK